MEVSLPFDDKGPCPQALEELLAEVLSDEAPKSPSSGRDIVQCPMLPGEECCKRGCQVPIEEVKMFHADLAMLGRDDQDDLIWDMLRRCLPDRDTGLRKFRFGCHSVCQKAWKRLVGMGSYRLNRMVEALDSGRLHPPEDQRRKKACHLVTEKYLDVDAFFNFLYHYVAEPLADLDERSPEVQVQGMHASAQTELCSGAAGPSECTALVAAPAPSLLTAPCAGKEKARCRLLKWMAGRDSGCSAATSSAVALVDPLGERRWLPHMTMQELFKMYLFHGAPDSESKACKAKRTTFFRVFYKQGWSCIIKFRKVAQHARCETCARLSKQVRTAPLGSSQKAAEDALRAHRLRNFADRAVDFRLSQLSVLSATKEGMAQPSRILHVRIDGMDQAKFKCPRNMDNSKAWEKLWRPQLHCVGVIVEGVLEAYFLTDNDVKKNSDMELTILSLALEKTFQVLDDRGVTMPEHLSLTYDNTAREGKNQHMAKWMAWLVSKGIFRSVQDGNGMVGHTHNKLDQRFSVVGGGLARQTCLQTPGDFMTVIQQLVHPLGACELLVAKVDDI